MTTSDELEAEIQRSFTVLLRRDMLASIEAAHQCNEHRLFRAAVIVEADVRESLQMLGGLAGAW